MYILEEAIRIATKARKYNNTYLEDLKNKIDDFDKLIDDINDVCQNTLNDCISYYKMVNIFKGMISECGTYGQFIKQVDKNYGVLSDELIKYVIDNVTITDDNITFEHFYNTLNIPYNKNKIIMYILQGIKCNNNKNMVTLIKDGRYVDILNLDIDYDYVLEYIKM
jgi:hypothetical protein